MNPINRILRGEAKIGRVGYSICASIFRKAVSSNDKKRLKKQHFDHEDISILKDIPYINDKKKSHLLDIYFSKGREEENLPLLFDCHGGGFMYGYKELNAPSAYYLTRLGYKVSLFSYTLAPKADLETIVKEAYMALSFLYEKGEEYHLDFSHLYFVGDSAGAMIALLLNALLKEEEMRKAFNVKALPLSPLRLVFFSPMMRMIRGDELAVPYKNTLPDPAKKKESYPYLAYPLETITRENYTPIFFTTSEEDSLKEDSYLLAMKLDLLALPYEFHCQRKKEGKEFPHVYPVIYPEWEESKKIYKDCASFLKKEAL